MFIFLCYLILFGYGMFLYILENMFFLTFYTICTPTMVPLFNLIFLLEFIYVFCRMGDISRSLSCVWSKKYCLWGWLHCLVIFNRRSINTVWFVDLHCFCFMETIADYLNVLLIPIYLGFLLICKMFWWFIVLLAFLSMVSLGMEQIMRYVYRNYFVRDMAA